MRFEIEEKYMSVIRVENESELMLKINQGLAPDIQKRFDALVAKRQAETLTPEEHRARNKCL